MDKKKLKTGIISIVALIVIVFAFKDGLSYNKVVETVDDGKYTITVVNTSPENGELTLAVKQGDEYIDMEGSSIEVEPGTKTKTYFKDGNKGKTAFWAVDINGVMNYVYSSSVEKTLYKEDKFIKTVDCDITVYYFGEVDNGRLVSFYDTSVEGKRNLVGLDYVSYGEAADDLGVIEQIRKGFSQTGWSKDLSNITEDIEVYPTYKSNIYTIWRDYHSFFMHGLLITLLLSVVSVFLAMFMGVAICLVRLGDNKFFSFIATIYVEVIRGVPLLLQLLLIYVLLGPTKISFGSFFTTEVLSCIITLTINSSAYSSEIFRSGIQAVDKGQMEAGRALGLSKWQVYKKIVIPQGLKNSLPSIVNELVQMIKETSLAVSVDASIGELMSVRKNITAATYVNLPPFIIVAIIYFSVTFSLSKCVGLLEKRLASRD
ncbi:MAG: amino acid ABC transporter permease [Erysipelotrichaceae bacterium]